MPGSSRGPQDAPSEQEELAQVWVRHQASGTCSISVLVSIPGMAVGTAHGADCSVCGCTWVSSARMGGGSSCEAIMHCNWLAMKQVWAV